MQKFSKRTGCCSNLSPEAESGFREPDISYAPHAFWFWNGEFTAERMTSMSREMSRQKLNPGYIHARFYPRYTQDFWMSDEWLKLFRETVEETAKAGMHVSFTTGDPCFPAQRILKKHPELKAESLGWNTIDVTKGEIVDIPESTFVVAAKLNENPEKTY